MPWSRCSRRARAALVMVKLVLGAGLAWAQTGSAGEPLYLEVFINGQPTGLIANFVQRPEQRLAITITELTELKIRSDRLPVDRNGLVDLDQCSGLSYHYDQIQQTVRIEITDQGRAVTDAVTVELNDAVYRPLGLTEDERDQLVALLAKLRASGGEFDSDRSDERIERLGAVQPSADRSARHA